MATQKTDSLDELSSHLIPDPPAHPCPLWGARERCPCCSGFGNDFFPDDFSRRAGEWDVCLPVLSQLIRPGLFSGSDRGLCCPNLGEAQRDPVPRDKINPLVEHDPCAMRHPWITPSAEFSSGLGLYCKSATKPGFVRRLVFDSNVKKIHTQNPLLS